MLLSVLFVIVLFSIWFSIGDAAIILLNSEKRMLTRIPFSLVIGISMYAVIMPVLMRFLNFRISMIAALIILVIAAITAVKVSRIDLRHFYRIKLEKTPLLIILAILLINILAFVGFSDKDSGFHEALSLSLQNGNFPIQYPWYPGWYFPYHYAYNLLCASVSEFSGLLMIDAHKPIYILFVSSAFLMVSAILQNTLKLSTGKAILYTVLLIGAAPLAYLSFQVNNDIPIDSLKQLQILFADIRNGDVLVLNNYVAEIRHAPSMLKFPVFLTALYVYLFHDSSVLKYLILAFVLALTTLIDEPLAIIMIGVIGIIELNNSVRSKNKINLLRLLISALMLIILVLIQGGLIPTQIFYHNQILPEGSIIAQSGGISNIILRPAKEVIELLIKPKILFFHAIVILAYLIIRKRNDAPQALKLLQITTIVYFTGFFFMLIFTFNELEKNWYRTFYSMLYLFSFIYLIYIIASKIKKKSFAIFLSTLILVPSIVWYVATIGLSLGYFIGETKPIKLQLAKNGEIIRENIRADAILMSIDNEFEVNRYLSDPLNNRFTGLYSIGGYRPRDYSYIPDYNRFVEAKKCVDQEFLDKMNVDYILTFKQIDSCNSILTQSKYFNEISFDGLTNLRVFKYLPQHEK
jgi:hypothetical protein